MRELFSRYFFSSYFHVAVTKRPTATPPRLLHHSHDPPGQRKPPKTCRDRTRTTAPCVASSCAASNRAGCQAWRESTTLDRHAASALARCSLVATVAYHERQRHHRCAHRRLVDLLHDARADQRRRADRRRQPPHDALEPHEDVQEAEDAPARASIDEQAVVRALLAKVRCGTVRYGTVWYGTVRYGTAGLRLAGRNLYLFILFVRFCLQHFNFLKS